MVEPMPPLADAIVVLGCTVLPGGVPSAALGRRVWLGAEAFRHGAADWIVASGGRAWHGEIEAMCIRRALVAAGVPEPAVALEPCSLSTLDNAQCCARLLALRGARSALLATSPWHLPRALRDFRSFGIRAVAPPEPWLRAMGEPRAPWSLRVRETFSAWLDARLVGRPSLERDRNLGAGG
jgi:uncharacterized SAM-binding protein YcdF (DUF218 family)